jgi:hypothetical protein
VLYRQFCTPPYPSRLFFLSAALCVTITWGGVWHVAADPPMVSRPSHVSRCPTGDGSLFRGLPPNLCVDSQGHIWSSNGTIATQETGGIAGSGAPTDAPYITQTPVGALTAEQALSALTTGLLKVTTATGVLSTAVAGTDYQAALLNSAGLAGALADETGTNLAVFNTSPTLVTPILGVATATSINKLAITAPATSATLTIANAKTFTASNTLTLTGTDGSTIALGDGGTVAYTANTLGVFAPTSSGVLATVLTDETGNGVAVYNGSPVFTGQVTIPDFTLAQHDHSTAAQGGTGPLGIVPTVDPAPTSGASRLYRDTAFVLQYFDETSGQSTPVPLTQTTTGTKQILDASPSAPIVFTNSGSVTTGPGMRFFEDPANGFVQECTDVAGVRVSCGLQMQANSPFPVRNKDGAECQTWDPTTGVETYNGTGGCLRPLLDLGILFPRYQTPGCGLRNVPSSADAGGVQPVVNCTDSTGNFIFLYDILPPQNWVPGTLATFRVPVSDSATTADGILKLGLRGVCKRPGIDTRETAWTQSATFAQVTFAVTDRLEMLTWTDVPLGGTCTATSVIQVRLEIEDVGTTSNDMGSTACVPSTGVGCVNIHMYFQGSVYAASR